MINSVKLCIGSKTMRKWIILLSMVVTFVDSAYAQEVAVDWAAKKITSQPSFVEKATKADVRIENVNDLMFTYSVSFQLKPLPISDFDTIAKAFSIAGGAAKAAGESATTDCDIKNLLAAVKAMSDAEAALVRQPATNSGCSETKPCNISLQAALNLWDQSVRPKISAAQAELDKFATACTSANFEVAIKTAKDSIAQVQTFVAGPHTIVKSKAIELVPDNATSLEVNQLWQGKITTDGSYSVDLQPANHRLTLSAGALFSEVQNRSYAVRAIPNGTGTNNVLAVDGLSRFSPTAAALLNYEIPKADWEPFGFAVSTGPVFRLGGKSDASSFGYFAGISAHLFHRFYVTPGFHLGEFADFPAGFTQPNQVVPSGLGTPTPVKRWTWRFGFALTYKAKDFGQFGLSGSVNQSTQGKASTSGKSTDTSTTNPDNKKNNKKKPQDKNNPK
jgi:hypothetical protein